MKNKSLVVTVLVAITAGFDSSQCSMNGAEEEHERWSCRMPLDRIGFVGLLGTIQEKEIIDEAAGSFLRELLVYYDVDQRRVHSVEYRRALNHTQKVFNGTLCGLLGLFRPTYQSRACILERLVKEAKYHFISQANPFMFVMLAPNGEILDLLLNNDGNLDKPNSYDGMTPLHTAIVENKRMYFDCLLDAGVNVDARDADARTPLGLAVESGNFYFVRALWFAGACLDAKDRRGYTPLQQAAITPQMGMIGYLFALGVAVPYCIQTRLNTFDNFFYVRWLEEDKLNRREYIKNTAQFHGFELPAHIVEHILKFIVSYLEPEESDSIDEQDGDDECDELLWGADLLNLNLFSRIVRAQ